MPARALRDGWEPRVSRTHGDTYYVNESTGQSTYDWPILPPGWTTCVSTTQDVGATFYVHVNTNVTTWDWPTLPPGWRTEVRGRGTPYYVNDITHEEGWEWPFPAGVISGTAGQAPALPPRERGNGMTKYNRTSPRSAPGEDELEVSCAR